MATYTVQSASQKKTVDGKYGPMQVIALTFSDGTEAEWFTKATTPLPAAGSTLEGDLEDGQYGKSFKKAKPAGGFSGSGGSAKDAYWEAKEARDLRNDRRMGRAHAQEMAIRVAVGAGYFQGEVVRQKLDDDLRPLIDWFDKDVLDVAGGGGLTPQADNPARPDSPATAAPSVGFASPKQADYFESLLKKTPATPETRGQIVLYAMTLPTEEISAAIDKLKDDSTRLPLAKGFAEEAAEWARNQSDVPADTTGLPELNAENLDPMAAVGSADDLPF